MNIYHDHLDSKALNETARFRNPCLDTEVALVSEGFILPNNPYTLEELFDNE